MVDPAEDRRVGDLVAVQVKDRQNGTIPDRVDEFVDMPAGGEGPCFSFAITNAGNGDQLGIVED